MSGNDGNIKSGHASPSMLWLRASLVWLIAAAIFGVCKSFLLVSDWTGTVADYSWAFGRFFLATKGAYIYGWGLQTLLGVSIGLFPGAQSGGRRWFNAFWLFWQIGVLTGVVMILCGNGSGIAIQPFNFQVLPFLIVSMLGVGVLLAGYGYRKTDRLSGFVLAPILAALCIMVLSMTLLYYEGGEGTVGMMLTAVMQGVYSFGAVVIGQTAFIRQVEKGGMIMRKTGLIMLALSMLVLVPLSGLANMVAWPIPWNIVYWGLTTSSNAICVLILVGVICLVSSRVARKEGALGERSGFLFRNTGMLAVIGWLIWKFVNPLTAYGLASFQFSIVQWYASDIFLLIAVGLVSMPVMISHGSCRQSWKLVLWMAVCYLPMLVCGVAVYAWYVSRHFEMDQMYRALSNWASLVGLFELIAWVGLAVGAGALLCGKIMKADDRPCVVQAPRLNIAVVCLMLGFFLTASFLTMRYGFLLEDKSREVMPFDPGRPGIEPEGSGIYAAEGCSLCHTQMVRRLINGNDLQQLINKGGQGDVPYRYSEPQDYDLTVGEGAAHAGLARVGPDLFNLAARADHYVTWRGPDGEKRRSAATREWLLMHLYNPRDPQLGKPWTICPPMLHLFVTRPVAASGGSPYALAVQSPPGYETVPTDRALKLVNYLLTLKRSGRPDASRTDVPSIYSPWSHISPEFARRQPDLDFSPLRRDEREALLDKGREIYMSRCAVCHGNDGMGDHVNYPPLRASEWIADKDTAIVAGIVRHGLSGPVVVKGRKWDAVMPPPGLAGRELAPLLTFLRRHFGGLDEEPVSSERARVLWEKAEQVGK